ncbi:MAG TPA: sulfur reduction protein DsrE [Nitrospiraceae bacterium]|jgi:sulfur relay (sulfurtransferase) complex TusBCD TusD component (DsrE family)|nr:sulfur reduction protein DsrE [Nitrospiraceae bacterium]
MMIGLIIHSNDAETVWNAFRYGNFAAKEGDVVKVFLIGKGVEAESLDTEQFAVTQKMKDFVKTGGKIFACGTCLKLRNAGPTDVCPLAGLKDMHAIIKESDRIIAF